jgi:hypothetical protein
MATLSGIITPTNVLTATSTNTVTNKTIAFSGNTLTGVAPTSNPVLTALKQVRVAVPASNIDLNAGNYFTKTISGTTTFTVSNVPASGTTASFILELTNGGSATVNWFAGRTWAGGTAPTLTASGVDVLGFYTFDGSTTWRGFVLATNIKA